MPPVLAVTRLHPREDSLGNLLHANVALANQILITLPRQEFARLSPHLKLVKLPLHSILNETAKPIEFGYFINGGLASILTVLKSGKIVEVGLTGSEGFVGLPLIAGLTTSATRVIAQVAGNAYRIRAKHLRKALTESPALRIKLQQYAQEVATQSAQIAACNRLHNANQRMARWLLMSQDRLGGASVNLTQEFLAHMLGMRRASVTVALGFLQKSALIAYKRRIVTIEDRPGLEAAACECYAAVSQHHARWRKEAR